MNLKSFIHHIFNFHHFSLLYRYLLIIYCIVLCILNLYHKIHIPRSFCSPNSVWNLSMFLHIDLVYYILTAVSVLPHSFIQQIFICTNHVPRIVLAGNTVIKETKYEHSVIYFLFPPLTDIRFCHDKECFSEFPCTGLLLHMLL